MIPATPSSVAVGERGLNEMSRETSQIGSKFSDQDENEKLRLEITRFQTEKVTAMEIFSETLSKYENVISEMEEIINTLREERADSEVILNKSNIQPQRNSTIRTKFSNSDHESTSIHQQANERRPFMAVASNLMSGWIGGGRARSPTKPLAMDDMLLSPSHSQQCSKSGTLPLPCVVQHTDDQQSESLTKNQPSLFPGNLNGPVVIPHLPQHVNESFELPRLTKGGTSTFWKSLIGIKPVVPPSTLSESRTTSEDKYIELWNTILNNLEIHKNTKRFQKMLQQGVPYTMRGALWKKAIGNRLLISRSLYISIVQRVRVLREYLMCTSKRYKSRLEETLGSALLAEDSYGGPLLTEGWGDEFHSEPLTPNSIEKSNESTENDGPVDQNKVSRYPCDLCTALWTPSIISAFETISADLHRTLPRLGVAALHQRGYTSNEDEYDVTNSQNDKRQNNETQITSDNNIRSSEIQIEIFPPHSSIDSLLKSNQLHSLSSFTTNDISVDPITTSFVSEERISKFSNVSSTEVGVRPLPVALCGRDEQHLYLRLRLLLESFVLFRPDIGYVQGMGFIAAMLLLYIENDYEAFSCFANLLMRQSLLSFYTFDLQIVNTYFKTFDILLMEKIPAMAEALNKAQIPSSQFLVDWMYTLFTRCLPFELVCRIWDLYLTQGDVILFQIALGMLKHFELEEADSGPLIVEKLSTFLSSSSTTHFESIQPGRFLEVAYSVAPQRDRLSRLMRNVQQSIRDKTKLNSQQSGQISFGSGSSTEVMTTETGQDQRSTKHLDTSHYIDLPYDSTVSLDHPRRRTSVAVSAIKRSLLGNRRPSRQVMSDIAGDDGTLTPASILEPSTDIRLTVDRVLNGHRSHEPEFQQYTAPTTPTIVPLITPGPEFFETKNEGLTYTPDWFSKPIQSNTHLFSQHSSKKSKTSDSFFSRGFHSSTSRGPTPLRRIRSDDITSPIRYAPLRHAEASTSESLAPRERRNRERNEQKKLIQTLSPFSRLSHFRGTSSQRHGPKPTD